jgi:hypothetical protein
VHERLQSILLRQTGAGATAADAVLTFMAISMSRQRVWCACSSSVIRENRSSEGRSKWLFFTLHGIGIATNLGMLCDASPDALIGQDG